MALSLSRAVLLRRSALTLLLGSLALSLGTPALAQAYPDLPPSGVPVIKHKSVVQG